MREETEVEYFIEMWNSYKEWVPMPFSEKKNKDAIKAHLKTLMDHAPSRKFRVRMRRTITMTIAHFGGETSEP